MSDHTQATIVIGIRQPDGTLLSRSWITCGGCAEVLAQSFGPPADEMIATPDAADAMQTAMGGHPGVLRLEEAT